MDPLLMEHLLCLREDSYFRMSEQFYLGRNFFSIFFWLKILYDLSRPQTGLRGKLEKELWSVLEVLVTSRGKVWPDEIFIKFVSLNSVLWPQPWRERGYGLLKKSTNDGGDYVRQNKNVRDT